MSWAHNRFLVAVVTVMVVAAAAIFLCRPAKAQEPTDAAVTDEAQSAASSPPTIVMPDDKWHFGVTPYLWFAGTHGTAGFAGRNASFHASFGDIFSYLNIGIMGAVEVRKERFVFPVDFLWMKLSDDKAFAESPVPAVSSIKVKIYESILTPKAGYLVVNKDKLKLAGTVGIRYWHLGENLNVQPANLGNSQSANWVDVVAGARLQMPLSPKVGITILGDAGAGAANLDYQVVGLLSYRLKPKIISQLGWRYLDVNYRPSSTFVYDGVTSGILLGITFNLK
jgi:hypothetical protein